MMDNFEVETDIQFVCLDASNKLQHIVIHRELINLTTGECTKMESRTLGMMTQASIRSMHEQIGEYLRRSSDGE